MSAAEGEVIHPQNAWWVPPIDGGSADRAQNRVRTSSHAEPYQEACSGLTAHGEAD
jgi:hypothetical protein